MDIVIHSHSFAPSVGGMETLASLLATHLHRQGHRVKVLTETLCEREDDIQSYPVLRTPSFRERIHVIRECDVFFQVGLSLHGLLPFILARPNLWVVSHHTWCRPLPGSRAHWPLLERFKLFLARWAKNTYCSDAVRRHIGLPGVAIGNPYDDTVFHLNETTERSRDVIFVGRLVSDKGANILLEALALLKQSGMTVTATIVGQGPEDLTLRNQAESLGIEGWVQFAGVLQGASLAECYRTHQLVVIPSLWPEPSGIVALEGLGCGCLAVASNGGGLPEVVNGCGLTFTNGNAIELAECIRRLLTDGELKQTLSNAISGHLNHHRAAVVAAKYAEHFQQWISPPPAPPKYS